MSELERFSRLGHDKTIINDVKQFWVKLKGIHKRIEQKNCDISDNHPPNLLK